MRSIASALTALMVWTFCASGVAAQDQKAKELSALQGGWIVMAAEQRGKPFEAIKGGVLIIEGQTFALKTAAGNEFKGEIRVDPTTSPKQLDFVHATGGAVWQAIYTVDEEMFRLNYVEAGGRDRRPTLFATSSDSGGTVIVMNKMARK
jgi:uncharacterized protein (TIGR03067 family)